MRMVLWLILREAPLPRLVFGVLGAMAELQTLLIHEAVGETRAVVLDSQGRAAGLFYDRIAEHGERLRWGQTAPGRIAKLAQSDGGAFIQLDGGHEGFLAGQDMAGVVEGARGLYRVVAEARADKLAKLKAASEEVSASPLALWKESLPGAESLTVSTGPDAAQQVDEAFEDALAITAPVPRGGRLRISPTPALVAIDVDTAGRVDKGRASARARAVNLAAAEEAARQIALRGHGGPVVLDCIAPLARRDGPDIKARFVQTFRALSGARVECLAPSPFGLMEAVLEWRTRPLSEACIRPDGEMTGLAIALKGLRELEREAAANPAARLRLGLPDAGHAAFDVHRDVYQRALIDRFGARIEIVRSTRSKIEVSEI